MVKEVFLGQHIIRAANETSKLSGIGGIVVVLMKH